MHPYPAFRQRSEADALAFARDRGFGVLVVNGAEGPLAAHVPFEIDAEGASLMLHLARSNPMLRGGLPAQGVMIVSGPDAYVSPDWYGVPDQVPTWNYVSVHLRGALEVMPAETLRAHLDRVAAGFEARLAPKPPWLADKMTPGVLERMMRAILPVRLAVAAVHGTVKLNQNKTDEARAGAAAGIDAARLGLAAGEIARRMRDG
ncbi:MAG: FMN-binding negative transcriptional regulator [Gemmobacter sp.]